MAAGTPRVVIPRVHRTRNLEVVTRAQMIERTTLLIEDALALLEEPADDREIDDNEADEILFTRRSMLRGALRAAT
jgi:hypothetical protein